MMKVLIMTASSRFLDIDAFPLERRLIFQIYAFKLKIPEQTTIEWFDGPHTINGKGTFEFLHRHLDWPITSPIEPLK